MNNFNPYHRTGTIAVTLLAVATITGLLLLFFYKLATPYESMIEISNMHFVNILRGVHRYTSDLSVVAVILHVLKMIHEKKTWGPRKLAWITGVFLTLLLFIIGWTGFVLVWDSHGQSLAAAGAEVLNVLPFFSGVLTRSVSGAAPVGTSFFFLNLFIHMSLPLGMVFLLWLHTSNLNQPAWFLNRKYIFVLLAVLSVYTVIVPPPLASPANLLQLSHEFKLNWYFAFIIPMLETLSPISVLLIMFLFFMFMLSIPFWLKPKEENKPKVSVHNQKACTGCRQCELDCPFSAISMVPRTEGEGSEEVAFVNTNACVGCGICSGSCSQMAIGPEDKNVKHQMNVIKELKAKFAQGSTLYIQCLRNSERVSLTQAGYQIDCTGNLHVASANFALRHFSNIKVLGCPPESCINRHGQKLLEDRFLHQRDPEPPPNTDLSKVEIFPKKKTAFIKTTVMTSVLMAAFGILSSFPFKKDFSESVLRLALRIPSQTEETCTDKNKEDAIKQLQHMRSGKICSKKPIDFHLQVMVDDEKILIKKISAKGIHGDKPMVLEKDFVLKPGVHKVQVILSPIGEFKSLNLNQEFKNEFESGKATLLYFNNAKKILELSKVSLK